MNTMFDFLHAILIRSFLFILAFMVWWKLKELPPTSEGGFWHYFWIPMAILIGGGVIMNVMLTKAKSRL